MLSSGVVRTKIIGIPEDSKATDNLSAACSFEEEMQKW
jgi:hypothetical protein